MPSSTPLSTSTPPANFTPTPVPTESPTPPKPDFSPDATNSPSLIRQLALQSDTYAIAAIAIMLSMVVGLWAAKRRTKQP